MSVTIGQIYESLEKYEKDNYYLKNAEPQKFGNGWEKLGHVEINNQAYKYLTEGKDPSTGKQLVDDRNGHRLGYNITFSPDKSFSVAAFSSPELKEKLLEAHHAAVRDTLSYMEKELAQVRTGQDGEKIPVKTGNLIGFTIDHTVNRDGDVQIHTHAVLFNMSFNHKTDKWQAFHSDAFKSNILEKVYENQLASHLQQRGIPVEWKKSESGRTFYAAIAGVPHEAIEATSGRAKEIQQAVEKLKEQYPNATKGELKQMAAYITRPDKKEMTLEQIEKQFEDRLMQVGLTKQEIVNGINQAKIQAQEQKMENANMNEYEIVKQAFSVISEQKSVFTKQDLIKASMDVSKGDVTIDKIQHAVNEFVEDKELIQLGDGLKTREGSRTFADDLYTTRENLLAEKNIFKTIENTRDSLNPIANKEQVEIGIKEFEKKAGYALTNSQKEAVITALTNKDMVTCYQGFAGVGKTESLKAIKELAEQQGYRVMGMSETNVSVGEMRRVGIDAVTVTKFLTNQQLKDSIDNKTVMVIDECSFMGAKSMNAILQIAQQNNVRVLLFGDKNQLPPIAAGYPFKDIQEKGIATVVEMKDLVRYQTTEQKKAIESIVAQDIDKAFNKLNVIEMEMKDIYKETANLYIEKNGYKDYIISTRVNIDKNNLNNEIRTLLKERGIVSTKEHTFIVYNPKNLQVSERLNIHNYQIGDRLIVAKAGVGAKVGAELTVKSVDKQNHTVVAFAVTKQGLKEYNIDIRRFGNHFNVYTAEQKNFTVGDKIIFNANLKEQGQLKAANSEVGYIKSIENSQITIQKGRDVISFDASRFQYFDYGYSSTTYKAQGKTSQGAIYFAPVQDKGPQRNYQDFYVAVSRAKTTATVITNDKEKLKEQVKQFQEKETISKVEQQHKLNLDPVYKDLKQKEQIEQQKQPHIDLSKNFKTFDKSDKKSRTWHILPGVSYDRDKGLIVSNTKSKDTFLSILTGRKEDKTFIKESKVILGKEKGTKIRTEYQRQKGLLGEKIKGTTVTVNKDKSTVTITKWSVYIDQIKDLNISRLANVKSESFSINVKGLQKDLEKLKSTTQDKGKIKHIEKAQKHLEKLTDKADYKHYEKAKNELAKAGIDLDKIKEQSREQIKSDSLSRTDSKSITAEKTISNAKQAEINKDISNSKSKSSYISKTESTKSSSMEESTKSKSIDYSRGR